MTIVIDNNGSKFEYNYFNNPIGYNNKSLKTFVLPASQNIYHFLYDFVGQILLIVKNENASQIKIIVTFHWDDDRSDNIILFLKNFFKKIQIDNYLIVKNNESFNDTDYYYVHECNPPSIAMHKEIYDAFMNAYPTEIKLPNKKVYLSRLKTDNPTNPMRPQRIDDEKTVCIPDPYFTFNEGHIEKLNAIDKNFVKWESKINECTWRGSPTYGLNTNFFDPSSKDDLNPRIYFIKLYYENKFKNFSYDDSFMDIVGQINYKYILDIDGWTNTWDGTVWKLYSGSVLLKVKGPWKQWYYDDIKEYVHYVPVENDFSNLNEQIEWCINNEEKCLEIVYNARQFVINKLNWDYVKNKTIENVKNFL